MRTSTQATIHYCDGCSKEHIQLPDADMPTGFYLQVTEVTGYGADAGELFVCGTRCILPAFKRRHEVWDPEKYARTQ